MAHRNNNIYLEVETEGAKTTIYLAVTKKF